MTHVVVKAFSDKAKKSLFQQRAEDEAFVKKYGGSIGFLRVLRLPKAEKEVALNRLKLVNAYYYAKEDNMFCHRIIGLGLLNDKNKADVYEKIKEEMLNDGLSLDEFEVRFYDE